MKNFFLKNNYFFGALLALVVPVISYGIFYALSQILINAGIWHGFNRPENIYILSLIFNIILFRIYFVRLKADKTGRGLLLVTIVLILLFFYLFFQNPGSDGSGILNFGK